MPSTVSVGFEARSLDGIVVSAYPNPFEGNFTVQFNLFGQNERVLCSLTDLSGRVVFERELGVVTSGLHYMDVEVPEVNSGMYVFSMVIGGQRMVHNMVKL